VLEGDPQPIAGRLGDRLLARPGDQEIVVAGVLVLAQGLLLAVVEDIADQGVGVITAGMPRPAGQLLDVHAERHAPRGGDGDTVTGMADGQLEVGAGDPGLAVRLAALGTGTVEGYRFHRPVELGGDDGLGQGAADQEALTVLLAAVSVMTAALGVIEKGLKVLRRVLTACPPYVGRCGSLRHSVHSSS
jgi:hypothetical protein